MKFYHSFFLFLLLASGSSCQDKAPHPSSLQYAVGYPSDEISALNQLKDYPLPRYFPNNHLQRLFNWMNPDYMGSRGQAGVTRKDYTNNSVLIQQELITDWNYGIVIPSAGSAFNGADDTVCPAVLKLANLYPGVPLDVILFWTQGRPRDIGLKPMKPMIMNPKVDSAYLLKFTRGGNAASEIGFNFPDSLIHIDGEVQKFYLTKILKCINRPINRINENGEEPPGSYMVDYIKNDPAMIRMKDSMKINSWDDFAATLKLHMRTVYSSSFMKELPQLKNTFFSFYTVEGGPIDRFSWPIMKKCMTPLNNMYYSTPDFYPRWPKNWKDWMGAWHGWKWLDRGRTAEIDDSDKLFSPFVAAGWSKKNEENITPGQWLGLLKCLSVIGAEFYYVGYFNLSPPFPHPSDYVWQAAMPAYAQAITSRFEDVLKDGNVLFDKTPLPIISYPTNDTHVLITARKKNHAEKYVICGTYQPFSNDSDEIAEKKNVNVTINGHTLTFEIRRQGSVYLYEKTPDNRTIFYQLDKWHENKHPEWWSKDFNFEAEVADSGINSSDIYTTTTGIEGDYSNFISYIQLGKGKQSLYHFDSRDSLNKNHYLWVCYKGNGGLIIAMNNEHNYKISQRTGLPKTDKWTWAKVTLPDTYNFCGNNALKLSPLQGEIDIDKFVITTNGETPPVY
ncbi:MAG TPA: hypothetical protein VK809_09885 [Bacteroidia bacterium]|nr:hypothetical protein [Bacteroidia bacterium]